MLSVEPLENLKKCRLIIGPSSLFYYPMINHGRQQGRQPTITDIYNIYPHFR